jgi:ABC-type iron transport system FetAB permease component
MVSGIIQVKPWYDSQYLIPLLAMILGSSLTRNSLSLEGFTEDLINRREQGDCIASLNSSKTSVEKVNNLSNSEYVAAATQIFNTNAQEQIALEELAACVGLSTPEITTILN